MAVTHILSNRILLVFVFCMGMVSPVRAIVLAEAGKAKASIVLATGAGSAEQTAAAELADYLHRITGATFPVRTEEEAIPRGSRILVGSTAFAAGQGLDGRKMGAEEWIIRTAGQDLIIMGGMPRGTIYAAYHFLEDVLGVHWWNPFEETVPRHATLRIGSLRLQGHPALDYRDIYMLYGRDDGRFAARNRLNRDGDALISGKYGGCSDYGPPYHVHTFNLYFPPAEYFKPHPEWYSLIEGRRVGDGAQLCLTQPDLRKTFLAKLVERIDSSWAAAKASGSPPPLVYSVSQNDCLNPCQCTNCQALALAEESECGPLLDFVNYLADGIRQSHPGVYIDTLAYQYTQKAPRTIRPRDNVIVRLCDTESDPTQPITAPVNTAFREHLLRWSAIAKNLRVWDYAVTYANPVGMPMPTAQTYGADYRFYVEHNVKGVLTELEFEILADMRDLKVWIMMKQLEDSHASYEQLEKTFTEGFYGSGGRHVRQYLDELRREAVVRKTHSNWNSTPTSLTYLNPGFISRAQALFERAERSVRNDSTLLRRVRHARMPLDRATVVTHTRLMQEWLALGKHQDRNETAKRVMQTWMAEARLRLPESSLEAERKHSEAEMLRYSMGPERVVLPEKFRDQPKGAVCDYLATMSRNYGDVVKVVKDPEAETGIANKLDLSDPTVDGREKYVLPMPWGLYDTAGKRVIGAQSISPGDVPGPGYHWYRMGTLPIAPECYVYFFWSWIIQVDVDNAYDPGKPDQQYDLWARIRFEGPRFPHAKPGDPDAIYVERLLLVKAKH